MQSTLLWRFLQSASLSAVLFSTAYADDTEIFYSQTLSESDQAVNILFMFDTSGSMGWFDNGSRYSRMIRLKQAMLDVIDTSSNVNIGLGRFNGARSGGAIVLAPVGVDDDICIDNACDDLTTRTYLAADVDDAEEDSDGVVSLSDTVLELALNSSPLGGNMVGLRFSGLNVPRGATINNATLEFISNGPVSGGGSLNISGQLATDAPVFEAIDNNLSVRAKTQAQVTWTPGTWEWHGLREVSSDIGSVIQEIVNQPNWCGGNAAALFVDGSSRRFARSRENNRFEAPVLRVSYDPSTLDTSNTCVNKRVASTVTNSFDDVVKTDAGLVADTETLASHFLPTDGVQIRLGSQIGLRFRNVQIPAFASVSSAYLRLVSGGFNDPSNGTAASTVTLDIAGDRSGNSAEIEITDANNLSDRTATDASVAWQNIAFEPKGNGMRSPDISDIVSDIVAEAGWQPGNAMSFILSGVAGANGEQLFGSADDSAAAKLVINYRLDGADYVNDPVPLRTGRDEIADTMMQFEPYGGTPLVDAYYEAAAYMSGSPVVYGRKRGTTLGYERLFRTSSADTYTGGNLVRPPTCSEIDLDNVACVTERIVGNPVYNPPLPGVCQANQIVLLSDGAATSNTSSQLVRGLTGTNNCQYRANGREACGLELSTWLSETDHVASMNGIQPVITHTVGFSFSSSLLSQIAENGGGGYYTAESSSDLVDAFSNIIQQAADVNTAFVAPATSVSQSNRLVNSNDMYFNLFQPSIDQLWTGNLKKYELSKTVNNQIQIVDANGNAAFDASSGLLVDSAQSFWSDAVDGADIAKGGAASKLSSNRNTLTYVATDAGYSGLVPLSETNTDITAEMLGLDGGLSVLRDELLTFSRGVDVKDSDGDGNTTEVRAQMGDPLHSESAIVAYDDRTIVYVGTNEGYLHAIDAEDGTEEFAFMPYELLGNIAVNYANPATTDRTYGLDGPITSWIDDINRNGLADDGEDVYLFVAMRRGGRNYYALNVTDPENPELAWVIRGGEGDFVELGQTWSKPVKTRVRSSGVERDVLIFAAGYDTTNDTRAQRDDTDTVGRGIYIVDAKSGQLIASKLPENNSYLTYSMPSATRVIDINVDGLADYFFVGDMGGQVLRFDIDNYGNEALQANLTGGVVADFAGASVAANRRFFYEPDVALLTDDDGHEFLNVSVGSGWRSHPLDQVVNDRFYAFRDANVYQAPTNASGEVSYAGLKKTESDLLDVTAVSATDAASPNIANGWYLDLIDSGEKVLSAASTLNKKILFTSYLPDVNSSGVCGASIGSGRVYAVDALTGNPVINLDGEGSSDALELTDRYKNLSSPGIPPGVSSLIPEVSPDMPVVLVGSEVLPELDFGKLLRRTFWAEH